MTSMMNPEKYFRGARLYPSTRTSMALWDRIVPVDVTLATPGTAENLFSVSQVLPTINIMTDPSIETGVTGWTAVGSAISQSAAQAHLGTNSMLVNPDNAATLEGAYWTTPVLGDRDPLTWSVYVRGASASGDVRVRIYGETSGTSWTGITTNLSTAFQRISITKPAASPRVGGGNIGGEVFRLYVETVTQHNINYYVDAVQAEIRPNATTYCDGAQGRDYYWDGTAHASVSRRYPVLAVIRGYTLTVRQADAYIDFDRVATTSSRLLLRGTDYWTNHPTQHSRISMINRYAGESPRIFGEINGVTWLPQNTEGE